jgi:hypothetical protein
MGRPANVIPRVVVEDCETVKASVELNVDERDELFELDLWKMDFSPLRRYPNPEDLKPLK